MMHCSITLDGKNTFIVGLGLYIVSYIHAVMCQLAQHEFYYL